MCVYVQFVSRAGSPYLRQPGSVTRLSALVQKLLSTHGSTLEYSVTTQREWTHLLHIYISSTTSWGHWTHLSISVLSTYLIFTSPEPLVAHDENIAQIIIIVKREDVKMCVNTYPNVCGHACPVLQFAIFSLVRSY